MRHARLMYHMVQMNRDATCEDAMAQGKKSFSAEFWIIIAVIGLALCYGIWNATIGSKPSKRAVVARVRTDQRSLAVALECYFSDHHQYPPSGTGKENPKDAQLIMPLLVCSRNGGGTPPICPPF